MAAESCRCKRQKILNAEASTNTENSAARVTLMPQGLSMLRLDLVPGCRITNALKVAAKFNPVKAAPWLRSPAARAEDHGPACKPTNMENSGQHTQTSKKRVFVP